MKRALSISASDSSALSGVQADLRVFDRCGVRGVCAVTLLAAQDTFAVRRVFQPAPSIVGAQIDAVVRDIGADACKVGWFRSPALATVIAGRVRRHGLQPAVLDPCLWSARGEVLTPPATVKCMVRELLPVVAVVTVTLRELALLCGEPLDVAGGPEGAAHRVRELGPQVVVVEDAPGEAGPRVAVCDASGCEAVGAAPGGSAAAGTAFSAALTAALARGETVREAARYASTFVASEPAVQPSVSASL